MCYSINFQAQVGINTSSPNPKTVLDIKSSRDGVNFGGLMPPIVNSVDQRNSINPGLSEIGLMVFLNDVSNSKYCMQMWNGTSWENIHCLTVAAVTQIAKQDFDLNQSWTYTNSPDFYHVFGPNTNEDLWDIVNTLDNITGFTANFLGCRDLDNSNGGGNFNHSIAFNNVNLTAYSNVQLSFDYDVFEFDNGDDVLYEVFYDDVGQGQIQLIDGSSNYSENGTVTINIPDSVTIVRITLEVTQDGNADMAGFDNFQLIGL